MPTRHLSDEQRQRYARFAAAPSADQLARYFHLDRGDREVVDGLRGEHNRLGFALMLGSARFLGAFPGADLDIPHPVTAFLIDQLGLKPAAGFKGYFDHNGQRLRHLALIRERYGFTEFADNGLARFRLTRWLYALCWSGDDHPGPLIERATSWLVVNKVLLPGVTVLERFVGRIRDRAQKRLWHRLVAALDEAQRARISALFDETNEASFTALDALRTVPRQRSSGELLLHLDRLEAIRAFDLRPSPPKGVPAATLERLARVARAGKPSAIAALQEPRRTATVAALFHTLEAAAQDDAAELAEALLTDLVKDAEAAEKQARLRSLRDLDDAAILLRDMAALVFKEDALPLDQWRHALFQRLPRADLVAAMAEVDAIARPHDAKPYAELRSRWRRARRLFFNIVTRLQMDAAPGGKAVHEALRYLATTADWSHATMRDAPTAAIPKAWQPLVLDADGRVIDPKAYVFAVIDAWRAAVKRRDIFASPGTRYGDPRRGLLDGATWQASKLVVCRALNRSLDVAARLRQDADTEIAGLAQWLDGAYRTVADRAASNPDLRLETVEGKTRIVIAPLDRLEDTESLRVLRPAIQGRMPKAAMPDPSWKSCGAPGSPKPLRI